MHKTRSPARMIPYQSGPIFATSGCRRDAHLPATVADRQSLTTSWCHRAAVLSPRRMIRNAANRNHAARRVFVLRYSPQGAPDMARKYSKGASKKVARAMKKRKKGTLKSGRSGKKVKSRKQAIAIGLSEARKEGKKVPKKKSSKKKSAKKSSSSSRKKSATRKKKTTKKRSKKSRS
jgi:hypothetical protein